MGDEQQEGERTQLSQPKRGKPIEMPVPKRGDFEQLVTRAANTTDGGEDEKPAAT